MVAEYKRKKLENEHCHGKNMVYYEFALVRYPKIILSKISFSPKISTTLERAFQAIAAKPEIIKFSSETI